MNKKISSIIFSLIYLYYNKQKIYNKNYYHLMKIGFKNEGICYNEYVFYYLRRIKRWNFLKK